MLSRLQALITIGDLLPDLSPYLEDIEGRFDRRLAEGDDGNKHYKHVNI